MACLQNKKQSKSQHRPKINGNDGHFKAFLLSKLCYSFEGCSDCRIKPVFLSSLAASLSVAGKCPQPCRNGGKCIGKSKCKCPKGYQGDLCSKRKYHTVAVWVQSSSINVLSGSIQCPHLLRGVWAGIGVELPP